MRSVVLFSLALGCAALSACASAEADAENICEIATEVQAQTWASESERSVALANRISELHLTSGTRTTFEAVAHAEASMKYPIFQAGLAEQGVEGWECPALEALMAGE